MKNNKRGNFFERHIYPLLLITISAILVSYVFAAEFAKIYLETIR